MNVLQKVINKSQMFYEISEIKLKMIFQIVKNKNNLLDKKQIPQIMDTFFQQMIVPYQNRDLEDSEIQIILENFKCAYQELSDANQLRDVGKEKITQILYENNFRLKIPSILFLDNYEKITFTLHEFYKFYNEIERDILYTGNQRNFRIDSVSNKNVSNQYQEDFVMGEQFGQQNVRVERMVGNQQVNVQNVNSQQRNQYNQQGNVQQINNKQGNMQQINNNQQGNMQQINNNQQGNLQQINNQQQGNMKKINNQQQGNMQQINLKQTNNQQFNKQQNNQNFTNKQISNNNQYNQQQNNNQNNLYEQQRLNIVSNDRNYHQGSNLQMMKQTEERTKQKQDDFRNRSKIIIDQIIDLGDYKEKNYCQAQELRDQLIDSIAVETNLYSNGIVEYKKQIFKSREEINSFQFRIQELIYEIDKRDQVIIENQSELIDLRKKFNEGDQKQKDYLKGMQQSESEHLYLIEQLQIQVDTLKATNELLVKDKDEIVIINDELSNYNERKKLSMLRMREEQSKMKEEVSRKISLINENEKMKKKVLQMKESYDKEQIKINKKYNDLLEECNIYKNQLDLQYQKQNPDKSQISEQLFDSALVITQNQNRQEKQKEAVNMQIQESQVDILQDKIKDQKEEYVEIQQERAQLQNQLQDFKLQIQFLKTDHQNFQQQIEDLHSEKIDLEKQRDDHINELKVLYDQISDKNSLERKIKILIREKKEMRMKIEEKNGLIENLKKQILNQTLEIKILEEKLAGEMMKISNMSSGKGDITKFDLETLKLENQNLKLNLKNLQKKFSSIENSNIEIHQTNVHEKFTFQFKDKSKIKSKSNQQSLNSGSLNQQQAQFNQQNNQSLNSQYINLESQQIDMKMQQNQNQEIQVGNANQQNYNSDLYFNNSSITKNNNMGQIMSILKQQRMINSSYNLSNSGVKQYSYDHLEIYKQKSMLKIIEKYQGLKNIKGCFSDVVYRLNSWSDKKKKWIVITNRYVYIFSSYNKLKTAIRLRDINKIKHNENNNYIGICTLKMKEEILETLKKEEMLLYLNRKIKKIGKTLELQERDVMHKHNRKNNNIHFDPMTVKKFKPCYQETFRQASIDQSIGYVTIESKSFLGMIEKQKEVMGLITNYGIVFFQIKDLKIQEFFPLYGSQVKIPEDPKSSQFSIVLSDNSEKILLFISKLKRNAWLDKIQSIQYSYSSNNKSSL